MTAKKGTSSTSPPLLNTSVLKTMLSNCLSFIHRRSLLLLNLKRRTCCNACLSLVSLLQAPPTETTSATLHPVELDAQRARQHELCSSVGRQPEPGRTSRQLLRVVIEHNELLLSSAAFYSGTIRKLRSAAVRARSLHPGDAGDLLLSWLAHVEANEAAKATASDSAVSSVQSTSKRPGFRHAADTMADVVRRQGRLEDIICKKAADQRAVNEELLRLARDAKASQPMRSIKRLAPSPGFYCSRDAHASEKRQRVDAFPTSCISDAPAPISLPLHHLPPCVNY